MDREAVPMCSGGFGVRVVDCDRLTTKPDVGEVVQGHKREEFGLKG